MVRKTRTVAVVIPCYRVEDHIEGVIRSLPDWITHVIAVNDASPDSTASILARLAEDMPRLRVKEHLENGGVGAAMTTGFREALKLGASYVVKMDGDGQMDPIEIPRLLAPLIDGRADYAKGNRFRRAGDIAQMPKLRLVGNVILTFLTKMASGYWHVFDVQNGYFAITREALAKLQLEAIERSYAFENSMLCQLNIQNASVIDLPMPAIYGEEKSSMSLLRVSLTFPVKLLRMLVYRVFSKYLFHDVSPIAIYSLVGSCLFTFSFLFGSFHWWRSATTAVPASTGTVILALLPFLMGFSLFLQAIDLDIRSSPRPRSTRSPVSPEEVPSMFGAESQGSDDSAEVGDS